MKTLAILTTTSLAIVGSLFFFVMTSAPAVEIKDPTEISPALISDVPAPELEPEAEPEPEVTVVVEEEPIVEAPVVQAEPEEYKPTSGLTKRGGVNYYNGRRETYYSSKVLRHYMIDQWHTDDNGVWRDSDGYIVVAASDIPYGTVIDTSFGAAKVYDCGCADGTTDIYVNW